MWLPLRVTTVIEVCFRPGFHPGVKKQAFAEYFHVWLTFFRPALFFHSVVNTLSGHKLFEPFLNSVDPLA
jgi:hypothetical protein